MVKDEENTFTVIKASGEEVPFQAEKLFNSLKRAGADPLLAGEIVDSIRSGMHDRMRTKEIYSQAFRLLKKEQKSMAARYSLKNAIMELGPAGYPFEKFVARLLDAGSYTTQTNIILQGKCIDHEVDVLATDSNKIVFIECKYHSDQGRKSDVKTSLYFHSRFRDLEVSDEYKGWQTRQGWLVTNTRFTDDAIRYGNCSGIQLISWNQPRGNALKEIIENAGLHPVTCLTTITRAEKRDLVANDILLCSELVNNSDLLETLISSGKRVNRILQEATELCKK